jgi:hypothetical protein
MEEREDALWPRYMAQLYRRLVSMSSVAHAGPQVAMLDAEDALLDGAARLFLAWATLRWIRTGHGPVPVTASATPEPHIAEVGP